MPDHRTLRGVAPRTAWPALALGAVLALTLTGCTSAGDDPASPETRAAAGEDDGARGPAAGSEADEDPSAPEPDEELTAERPGDADGDGEQPADDGPAEDGPAGDSDDGDDGSGGDGGEVSPPAPLPLTGTEWHVVSVTTGGETVRADSTVVGRMVFDDDGSAGIRACNSISGTARQLGGGRLDLDVGMGTRRMCTGLQQQLENGVVGFLSGTADYTVTGDRLVLAKANGDRMELRGIR